MKTVDIRFKLTKRRAALDLWLGTVHAMAYLNIDRGGDLPWPCPAATVSSLVGINLIRLVIMT